MTRHQRDSATALVGHFNAVSQLAANMAAAIKSGQMEQALFLARHCTESLQEGIRLLRSIKVRGDESATIRNFLDAVRQKSDETVSELVRHASVENKLDEADIQPWIEVILKGMAKEGESLPTMSQLAKVYKEVSGIGADANAAAAIRVFEDAVSAIRGYPPVESGGVAHTFKFVAPYNSTTRQQYEINLKLLQFWHNSSSYGNQIRPLLARCRDQIALLEKQGLNPNKRVGPSIEDHADASAYKLLHDLLYVADSNVTDRLAEFSPLGIAGVSDANAATAVAKNMSKALSPGRIDPVLRANQGIRKKYGGLFAGAAAGAYSTAKLWEIWGVSDTMHKPEKPDSIDTKVITDISPDLAKIPTGCQKTDLSHFGTGASAISAHEAATLAFNLHCFAEDPFRWNDPPRRGLWNDRASSAIGVPDPDEGYPIRFADFNRNTANWYAAVIKASSDRIKDGWLYQIFKNPSEGFKSAYMVRAVLITENGKHYFQPQDCRGRIVAVPHMRFSGKFPVARDHKFPANEFTAGKSASWERLMGQLVKRSTSADILNKSMGTIIKNLKNWAASSRR